MGKPTGFTIPEDLTNVDGAEGTQVTDVDLTGIEDLAGAEQSVLDEASELMEVEDPSDEQNVRLEALADLADRIREAGAQRQADAESRRERRDAAKKRLQPVNDEAGEGEGGSEDGDGDDGESGDGDEGDGDEGAGDESGDEGAGDEGDESGADDAPDAVAAAGTRKGSKVPARRGGAPSLIKATKGQRQRDPQPKQEQGDSTMTMVASAGIRNVEPGSQFNDFDQLVDAFMTRAGSHPTTFVPDVYNRHAVASISRGIEQFNGFTDLNEEYRDNPLALLDAVADERSRFGSKGLAASGGWCAPSETYYDLVTLETMSGLFDQPEIGVKRGGINITTGPDFSDIYAGVGFSQTEAEAIAGTTKSCYEVECPEFDETRLDAVGLCVKSPLLTNSAYPELVRRVLAGALVAHAHKKSIKALSSVSTELGTAVVVPAAGSVARSVLTGLELAAEGQRAMFRMDVNATMEVVLPHWVRVIMRDDLQARLRQVEPVTDMQLDAHFAARKLRVQFVYGLSDTRIVTVPGGGTLLVDVPDTFTGMLYPAGTFVRGVHDVINLDTVYDSTDLEVNVYTAAFVEEGQFVARRAPGGGKLTFSTLSKGSVGPADLTAYGTTDA